MIGYLAMAFAAAGIVCGLMVVVPMFVRAARPHEHCWIYRTSDADTWESRQCIDCHRIEWHEPAAPDAGGGNG